MKHRERDRGTGIHAARIRFGWFFFELLSQCKGKIFRTRLPGSVTAMELPSGMI